jgi:hypothetical protein
MRAYVRVKLVPDGLQLWRERLLQLETEVLQLWRDRLLQLASGTLVPYDIIV